MRTRNCELPPAKTHLGFPKSLLQLPNGRRFFPAVLLRRLDRFLRKIARGLTWPKKVSVSACVMSKVSEASADSWAKSA
jgi:hypothetical protein